ncbi:MULTISPECIES: hypothetical protein [Flagellimonas]|uniref:RiboL-PSP-HEPN domain-containing protein n=1 Tax=Flagellimonas olearia TaxID=552546 RepID=A0A444VI55_9FLAO|nr:hypothetical protein [Allomuricauda olearia]RYC50423.1 hypothetical protein DN53_05755 [Allomuricauda olearia]
MGRDFKIGDSLLWTFQTDSVMLDFKFDPVISFLDGASGMIAEKEKEISRKFEEWNEKQKQDSDLPDAYDVYENEVLEHSKFPELLNNSVYLVLYAMFESHYLELCQMTGSLHKSRMKVRDLSGNSYIDQCRRYLIKVIGLDMDETMEDWNEILKHQRLRNAITHKSGKITEMKSDLRSFIDNRNGVTYYPERKLVQIESTEFLKGFIGVIKSYFNKVNIQIVRHYSQTSR